jgi:LysM repeat protein
LLLALLGVGFGLVQMINRPEASSALLAVTQAGPTAAADASTAPGVQVASAISAPVPLTPPVGDVPRQIHSNARVLEANYTVAAGDTLGRIALRFNTTVERIQALNNLADPRVLRIGTKLVIPPPF